MEGLQFFLLISQIIIAVVLIILVLAQKSDGDSLSGLSASAGGLNSAISGRATMSILNKVTMALIAIFMINCLILASLTKNKSKQISQELQKVIEEREAKLGNIDGETKNDEKTPATTKNNYDNNNSGDGSVNKSESNKSLENGSNKSATGSEKPKQPLAPKLPALDN